MKSSRLGWFLALWALLGSLLAGCARGGQPAETRDTLRWGLHVGIDRLDVQASWALATGMVVGRNVFDRLVLLR